MTTPRLALVVGGARNGSSIVTWPHAGGVVGEIGAGGAWFAWRLLGGNNRELGRSAAVIPTANACRAAADAVRRLVPELIGTVNADAGRGMWGWRLSGPQGPVAVSARFYLRQRECQYNLRQFLDNLPRAQVWGTAAALPNPPSAPMPAAVPAAKPAAKSLPVPQSHIVLPEPARPVDLVRPAEPVDLVRPAEPVDLVRPAEPVDLVRPAEPVDLVRPAEHASHPLPHQLPLGVRIESIDLTGPEPAYTVVSAAGERRIVPARESLAPACAASTRAREQVELIRRRPWPSPPAANRSRPA